LSSVKAEITGIDGIRAKKVVIGLGYTAVELSIGHVGEAVVGVAALNAFPS
jgi:hypothetical protein